MKLCRLMLLVVLGPASVASQAAAQDYAFSVPQLDMQVIVQPDGSARILYDIIFANAPDGKPIDVVDIGVPHEGYKLGNVTASMGGNPLRDVRPSEYVHPGFEVHLGAQTIPPGQTATLHAEFSMPDMVYQDTTDRAKASLQITPTWFGSKYVRGTTNLKIAVHVPAGVKAEEVVYHDRPFTNKVLFGEDKHVVAVWEIQGSRLTGPNRVGVSWPKRVMTHVIEISRFELLARWFRASPGARLLVSVVFFIALGILYFRFTGGTGFSLFVVMLIGFSIWFYAVPIAPLVAFVPLVLLMVLFEWNVRTHKPHYLPAVAQVEGGGIKRGLTAPEAAALLELPLGKVLGLVIFGLLKKGVVRQVQADLLAVEVNPPFRIPDAPKDPPEPRENFYRRAAQQAHTVIHNYEHPFLFLLQNNAGKPLAQVDFSLAVRQLLQWVARRVKGFDLSDTQDYYRAIVRRAIQQARAVGDIQQREKVLDRTFEWVLMDDEYPTVFGGGGYVYRPIWTRPATAGSSWTGGAAPATPTPGGSPTLGDVAGSFAGWTENTMGSLASTIQPSALELPGATSAVLDLSGLDHATGAFFKALGESGGGGGGGGGGCACACAGCACACACAGGGR